MIKNLMIIVILIFSTATISEAEDMGLWSQFAIEGLRNTRPHYDYNSPYHYWDRQPYRNRYHYPDYYGIPCYNNYGGYYNYNTPYYPPMMPNYDYRYDSNPYNENSVYDDLSIRPAGSIMILEIVPKDAEIFVDGYKLTKKKDSSYSIGLLTGMHKVQVIKKGFDSFNETVLVKPGVQFLFEGIILEKSVE